MPRNLVTNPFVMPETTAASIFAVAPRRGVALVKEAWNASSRSQDAPFDIREYVEG